MSGMWMHCGIAFSIRLLLICYAEIQDNVSVVQYTDVDYKVFTDAARHVLKGDSPFNRHTYRYTPLIAFLLTPNIFLHPAWGKLLFSILDIIVAVLIKQNILLHKKEAGVLLAERCTLVWLYNPLSIIISTRGNADSLAAIGVVITLLIFQKKNFWLAGIIHGLAIHVRLYPLAFSLAMYLAIPNSGSTNKHSKLYNTYLLLKPNTQRLQLVFSCVLTLSFLTVFFYHIYGFTFLDESLLFHLRRRDIRHNFSVYFYLQYLSCVESVPVWQSIVAVLPQLVLLIAVSVLYGTWRDLIFCELCQAIILVAYNSVLTCQYFVWFLSLMPLCLPDLQLTKQQAMALGSLWLAAQLAWLLPAYWLEFRGRDTFLYVWLQGVAFFCANMAVLARLIRAYKPHAKQQ